jgi:C-terminal processing protease CtpA/Prc
LTCNGPAKSAGLRKGDKLISVNRTSLRKITLVEAEDVIANAGSSVTMGIERTTTNRKGMNNIVHFVRVNRKTFVGGAIAFIAGLVCLCLSDSHF